MQPARFDAWTRTVRRSSTASSRRGLVFGAVGALLGGAPVAARGRCLKQGATCDPGKQDKCCSCRCATHGAGFRCVPVDTIGGCTGATNACFGPNAGCPALPPGGGSCVVTQDGQPYCARSFQCLGCRTDADCQRKDGNGRNTHFQLGRCIWPCPFCPPGTEGACVYPC